MYYKCVKFHKNPISGLGGVALTRYMDGRTDRVIPIYPPNFVCRGYKNPAHGENSRHRHHTINMLLVICHDIAVKFMLSCQLMAHNNQLLIFRYSQTSLCARAYYIWHTFCFIILPWHYIGNTRLHMCMWRDVVHCMVTEPVAGSLDWSNMATITGTLWHAGKIISTLYVQDHVLIWFDLIQWRHTY